MITYVLHSIESTIHQLLAIAGPLAVVLVPMQFAAGAIERYGASLLGERAFLYLFTAPGTVVHEGSHVVAALLCGHRVDHVRWFDPRARHGVLGQVQHSYAPWNVWHQIGNLAIGIAPVVVGAALIVVAAHLLLGIPLVATPSMLAHSPESLLASAQVSMRGEFTRLIEFVRQAWALQPWWRWGAFGFVTVAVGGGMRLSGSDLAGAARGAAVLVIVLGTLNLLTAWGTDAVATTMHWLATMSAGASRALLTAMIVQSIAALLLLLLARARRMVG